MISEQYLGVINLARKAGTLPKSYGTALALVDRFLVPKSRNP